MLFVSVNVALVLTGMAVLFWGIYQDKVRLFDINELIIEYNVAPTVACELINTQPKQLSRSMFRASMAHILEVKERRRNVTKAI